MNREFSKKAQEVWNELNYEDRLYATYFIFDQISEHMKNNGQDKKAKHKFQKANSKLNALRKYSATRKKN